MTGKTLFSGWLAKVGALFAVVVAAVGGALAYGKGQRTIGRKEERLDNVRRGRFRKGEDR
jgi:hypothetical protein